MFAEELKRIEEAESRADTMRKDGKSKVKALGNEADATVRNILETSEEEAKRIYDSLIDEGQMTGDREYDAAIAGSRADCEKMEKDIKAREEAVIDGLVERIVRLSGNN